MTNFTRILLNTPGSLSCHTIAPARTTHTLQFLISDNFNPLLRDSFSSRMQITFYTNCNGVTLQKRFFPATTLNLPFMQDATISWTFNVIWWKTINPEKISRFFFFEHFFKQETLRGTQHNYHEIWYLWKFKPIFGVIKTLCF